MVAPSNVSNCEFERLPKSPSSGAHRLEQSPGREVLQARHESESQQIAQAKDLISAAMGIDDMGADRQCRVIFQQSVQDVERFRVRHTK